jgi:multiple sugar transport system substrate-binding protein
MGSETNEARDQIEEVTDDARLSRREFVVKSAAGIAAGAAGATALGTVVHAARPAFTYPRYDGVTINALMVSGENDAEPLRDAAADIKSLTGINLVVTDLAIGTMHDKGLASLRAGSATYDIIDVLGFWTSEFVGPGYFTPLEPYLNNPKLTAPDYNFSDFPQTQLAYTGYFNTKTQTFGKPGALYTIPGAHEGACAMYYRADLLKAHGLKAPTTWDEYFNVVKTVHDPKHGVYGTSFVGANDPSLFYVDWYGRFASEGGQLMTGSPVNGTFTPHVNSPKGIQALQRILDVKPYAPAGVGSYGFTESVNAMERAKVGIMLMWGTIAGPLYDPTQSHVSSTIVTAPGPGTGMYRGASVRGGWGLGIPKNSPHKEAAWQVIQYFTTKKAEIYRTLKYNIEPGRISSHTDPQVVKKFPFMPVLLQAYKSASILDIAKVPQTNELINAATLTFNLAVVGSMTAEQACNKVNADWIAILKRGGYLK